ncbi:hypothetical protein EDF84_101966 [Erwinia rhapontici]|nr:hypothetical protein EDF84_101966 [Erwinia rhapontici]
MPDPYEDLCRGQAPPIPVGARHASPERFTSLRRGVARLARKDLHPLYGFNPQRIQPLLQSFRR